MSAATILFAGTPEFARASLRALVQADRVPAAVLTQPDRPSGRGRKKSASPVKTYAQTCDIEVWQPATLRDPDAVRRIEAVAPDIMIVAAYGLILPRAVLAIPRHGCLNVHASLLPRWRGASPIQHAILHGDAETGVCLMQMEAGLDTGPVFASVATPIDSGDTAGSLHDRLSQLGAELLVENIDDILAGRLVAVPQDEAAATYAGKILREDAAIDWTRDANEIGRQVRAYNPVPGAWFNLDGESIKCWRAAVVDASSDKAGTVLQADKSGIVIACGTGALRIDELQRPGRKRVSGAEFAAQKDLAGKRLG